VTQKNITKFMQ